MKYINGKWVELEVGDYITINPATENQEYHNNLEEAENYAATYGFGVNYVMRVLEVYRKTE